MEAREVRRPRNVRACGFGLDYTENAEKMRMGNEGLRNLGGGAFGGRSFRRAGYSGGEDESAIGRESRRGLNAEAQRPLRREGVLFERSSSRPQTWREEPFEARGKPSGSYGRNANNEKRRRRRKAAPTRRSARRAAASRVHVLGSIAWVGRGVVASGHSGLWGCVGCPLQKKCME
jgi:hypothetical protein